ncbi:GNAT superfamily N-acetyltransferase [Rhodanobacter sp. K2T2]|nr:GNAT family N-acetyltransferase [Rhodanobacter sp. K2T2]NYE28347.1 GNAT superfamily N-acetyltransferase [Rhodanobacter sp. K2T2]
MTVQAYRLRNATFDDLELAYEITKDAMRGYVKHTWGRWNEREQYQKHRDNYTSETHRLIEVGNVIAGLVATENLPDHVWLVKLYLLQAFRSLGIGAAVLEQVVQEAAEMGLPVRLRVLRVNERARALYARHGFSVVGETSERIFMERPLRTLDVRPEKV